MCGLEVDWRVLLRLQVPVLYTLSPEYVSTLPAEVDPGNPMLWRGVPQTSMQKTFSWSATEIDDEIIDSLSNLYRPIQCIFPILLCKFHIVPLKVHMGNPKFSSLGGECRPVSCASAMFVE